MDLLAEAYASDDDADGGGTSAVAATPSVTGKRALERARLKAIPAATLAARRGGYMVRGRSSRLRGSRAAV